MMLQGACRKKVIPTDTEITLDNDVVAEAKLVNDLLAGVPLDPPHEASLIVSGLSKTFAGANRPAVNEISFHVGRGECLGLLGVNGAGKTTTFRMLTGDEVPSSGDARIGNTSLRGQVRKVSDLSNASVMNPLMPFFSVVTQLRHFFLLNINSDLLYTWNNKQFKKLQLLPSVMTNFGAS